MVFHVVHVASEMPSYKGQQEKRSKSLLLQNLEQINMVKT
jgi:hypothetical protein